MRTASLSAWRGHAGGRAVQRCSSQCLASSSSSSAAATAPTPPPPSIFNDVLGPVMRGPSSSHSAAGLRIGRLLRDLLRSGGGGTPSRVLAEYDFNGSLVTTHDGQGSDMGLAGGLLGWDAEEIRLMRFEEELQAAGISTEVSYVSYKARHPNTYKLTAWGTEGGDGEGVAPALELAAISTGGGMLEVEELDGVPLSMRGDYWETLAFVPDGGAGEAAAEELAAALLAEPGAAQRYEHVLVARKSDGGRPRFTQGIEDDIESGVREATAEGHMAEPYTNGPWSAIVQIKSRQPLPREVIERLEAERSVSKVASCAPQYPVGSRREMAVPFGTSAELLALLEADAAALDASAYAESAPKKELWEYAAEYEAARGGITVEEVVAQMDGLVAIWREGIRIGCSGTEDPPGQRRILPCQAPGLMREMNRGGLVGGGDSVVNSMILYVTALMEVKSSMGVIVAAPTAGSCGTCPGAVLAVTDSLKKSDAEATRAMLVAGLIGVFVQERATFSAEVGGCMAETGSGAGMAAAAIVSLAGGTAQQALGAASFAIQNSFGLACDPVANRVEAPCLGKNVNGATNALTSANMALASYTELIPLDEVLSAMNAVGKQLPHELRCTGKGGLAVTPTAKRIHAELEPDAGTRGQLNPTKIAC